LNWRYLAPRSRSREGRRLVTGYDHAAYLGSWLKVLKEDKRAIFQAAAHAQRAADFLHGQKRPAS
jgi:antirestriction protein ArdC